MRPAASASSIAAGRHGSGSPDEAELRKRERFETDLVADEAKRRRAESSGHVAPDGEQRLAHDREGLCARDATAVDELDRDSPPPELGADLRPRTVDDDDLVTFASEVEGSTSGGGGDAPSELHHDARHVVYSAFSRT